jgi:hypothetical protein
LDTDNDSEEDDNGTHEEKIQEDSKKNASEWAP